MLYTVSCLTNQTKEGEAKSTTSRSSLRLIFRASGPLRLLGLKGRLRSFNSIRVRIKADLQFKLNAEFLHTKPYTF